MAVDVNRLIDGLVSEDPRVRSESARELVRIARGDAAVVTELAQRLKSSPSAHCVALLDVLRLAGEAAAPAYVAMVDCLARGSVSARGAARAALDAIPSPLSAHGPSLVRRLQSPSMQIRTAAARGLGRMGTAAASAVEPLLRSLGDPEGSVRLAAATALGAIGQSGAGIEEALTRRLADEDYAVREAAREALALVQASGETSTGRVRLLHLEPDKWAGSATRRDLPKPGGAYRGPLG